MHASTDTTQSNFVNITFKAPEVILVRFLVFTSVKVRLQDPITMHILVRCLLIVALLLCAVKLLILYISTLDIRQDAASWHGREKDSSASPYMLGNPENRVTVHKQKEQEQQARWRPYWQRIPFFPRNVWFSQNLENFSRSGNTSLVLLIPLSKR